MNKNGLIILLSLFMGAYLVGCSDSDDAVTSYEDYTDALITKFQLPANSKYAEGLADLYFTINQKGIYNKEYGYIGQIYNADSLPVGTVTSHLLADITTQSASEVMLYEYNEEKKDYSDSTIYSSTDSINFTKPVYVKVVAANKTTKKYYEIKVNVHTQKPDSIDWKLYQNNPLSNFNNVDQQKAVDLNGEVYWFTASGSNVFMNKASENNLSSWSNVSVTYNEPGTLDLYSLAVFNNEIYCLTSAGTMLKSADGKTFAPAMADNDNFVNIIGAYSFGSSDDKLIAIRNVEGSMMFSYYTNGSGWVNNGKVQSNFPIKGFSNSILYSSKTRNYMTIAGGVTADGKLVSSLWSYDGDNIWGEFPQKNLPAAQGESLITYESDPRYKDTFWFLISPNTVDGKLTSTIYYSKDKGVSWKEASSLVAFPTSFEARSYASVFVDNEFYINLIGGKAKGDKELNQIWRGRLNNLVFKPVE